MDIAVWLDGLGLKQYSEAFCGHHIGWELLATLTSDDLREIGVASLGHRKKLLAAIADLPDRAVALSAPVARPAERRQLTVMFVDLVGSTALSAGLDPEEMREVLGVYLDAVADGITHFDGHVARFLGDGVLAYFGFPQAHEDDAERAVRAGLDVLGAVGRLRTPGGEPLAARVGIATGLVVVGDLVGKGAAQEQAVVGDTPNLAARLQALAEPSAVVVAEATRRLLGTLFEFADLGPVKVKGFTDPVAAFRVVCKGLTEDRFEALHGTGAIPLVGRDQELALLLDRWRLARVGEGQVVLLSGEPGIGKSRIVLALRERLRSEGGVSLRYHCSPYHANSALHPVVEQLTRAAGFARTDDDTTRLAKLEALLAAAVADVGGVAPYFAELLSLPVEGRFALPPLTPQERKSHTFRALLAQLEGLAARSPVLMVLEDAHWSDPTTLELFDLAVQRLKRLPVLLVATYRPEFQPPWAGHAHATALALNRLERAAAESIVDQLTAGRRPPEPLLGEIIGKADGVPLFIEELTKNVVESGLLREAAAGLASNGPLPPLAIPATLHDSLMARLDRLAKVKEIAQIAAVIGREFPYDVLAAVAPLGEQALRAGLDRLAAAGLVFGHGVPPEATYSFKHALVQDVAYQSLLRSRRQQLHFRMVQVLEESFPEQIELEPEVAARHCTEAGLTERAIGYLQKAGRRAMARSAMAEAVVQFRQALGFLVGLPAGPDRDREELDLQVALGGALVASAGFATPEVGKAYGRAQELGTGGTRPPQFLAALSGLFAYRLHATGVDAARRVAEEMLCSAEDQEDVAAQVMAHRCLGSALLFGGRLSLALTHYELALALYDHADHASAVFLWTSDVRVACLNFVPLVLVQQGFPDQAMVRGAAGLDAARKLGHAYTLSHVLHLSCWLHQLRGEREVVLDRAVEMMSLSEGHGFPNWSACAKLFHGWALAAGGDIAPGIARMREGLAALHVRDMRLQVPYYLGLLAGLLTWTGQQAEALGLLDDALKRLVESRERWFEAELWRLRGETLRRAGVVNVGEVEICLRKAIDVAHAQNTRWWELRAATSLARLWAEGGERRRAHDMLAPIYGWFTEGFDTLDLGEARTLLDALA